MAGLGAMRVLAAESADFRVVETEAKPGGLARTDVADGFPFDQAGHFLHINSTEFRNVIRESGISLCEHGRRASIILDGHKIPYPIQFNLAYAPQKLREAVLGELRTQIRTGLPRTSNLEEYLLDLWGEPLVEAFFRPFNEKLWGRPLRQLPATCLGRYLPAPDPKLVEQGAFRRTERFGYNASFLYPTSGHIGDLAEAMARPHRNRIAFETKVTGIDLALRVCETARGSVSFEHLIWTAPLKTLLDLANIDHGAMNFEDASVTVLGLGVVGAAPATDHWVYVPDPRLPFHRMNFTAGVGALGERPFSQSILVEYGGVAERAVLANPTAAGERALAWAVEQGFLGPCELAKVHLMKLQPAYVIQRQKGTSEFDDLSNRLSEKGVRLAGRYGSWDYLSMEESFLSGSEAARAAISCDSHEASKS